MKNSDSKNLKIFKKQVKRFLLRFINSFKNTKNNATLGKENNYDYDQNYKKKLIDLLLLKELQFINVFLSYSFRRFTIIIKIILRN